MSHTGVQICCYTTEDTNHRPLSGVPCAARSVGTASFNRWNRRQVAVAQRICADNGPRLHATRLRLTDLYPVHTHVHSDGPILTTFTPTRTPVMFKVK